MKNKKAFGQGLMTLLVIIIFFMVGILIVGLIMPNIAMSRSDLDCTNLNISSGNKIACIFIDLTIPLFIMAIVVVSILAIINKIISS